MKEKKKFKIKKLFKSRIFFFILGIFLTSVIGVSAASVLYSKEVTYDNSSSGLSSTNLQDALDELYEQAKNAPNCDSDGNCTVTCPNGATFKSTSTGYQCVPFSGTVYAFNTIGVRIGTSTLTDLGTSYATFAEAVASNSNSYGVIMLKYTVEKNVLTEGYVCFISANDGNEYCLKGDDTSAFANNVAILNTAFPDCGASGSYVSCYDGSVGPYARSDGYVSAFASNGWECIADSYPYYYLMGA